MDAVEPQIRRWGTHPSWSRLIGNPASTPRSRNGSPHCSVPPTPCCCRRSPSSTRPSSPSSPAAGRCSSTPAPTGPCTTAASSPGDRARP
ncbi:hypothetical protein ACFQ60_44190 [Streptomyces zhihengii]